MSEDQVSKDRFTIMESKLFWGIMTPSAVVTVALGIWLITGTIGDDSGPAQIIFDGNGVNRTLYSATGEIGFLNNAANWAARSDANGDWI